MDDLVKSITKVTKVLTKRKKTLDGTDLGASIRSLRVQRELTIEEFAHIADIHATYLSKIERGRGNPTWNIITGIADAFGRTLDAFVQHVEGTARAREGYERVVQNVEKKDGSEAMTRA